MSRNRAPVSGGYVRKTISIPRELMDRIESYLVTKPGLTLSAFMTDAGEARMKRVSRKK